MDAPEPERAPFPRGQDSTSSQIATPPSGTSRSYRCFGGMDQLPPGKGQDWTDEERAEIRRIEQVCRAAAHWELECSHTDAGDPWCVIYDRHSHQIVPHMARIDRLCRCLADTGALRAGRRPQTVRQSRSQCVHAAPT